ncbi:MAG: stage V sporulation protein AD [Clostridia bacterium]|nr:stage V sporulation protein AD [Clostridia bacterium]
MINRTGKYTTLFTDGPSILGAGAVAGPKEAQGPLGKGFDKIIYDAKAGADTWEQAESAFQREALITALSKTKLKAEDLDYIFSGDLLNQCISSSNALKEFSIPYLGQYGACSTMAQSLIMAAFVLQSGTAKNCACVTSSHFCSAERQYRFPLEYGGQRTPSAQWTVTGSGCAILGEGKKNSVRITGATVGRILDLGVKDANNMGAAMAPAAAQTILDFFKDTGKNLDDFDRIFTGDLGLVGSKLLYELTLKEGYDLRHKHDDCGMLIFDRDRQDVHAGGSGCGCAASVLCSHILNQMTTGKLRHILFIATGALMSPTSCQQGLSIPCVAHLVELTFL